MAGLREAVKDYQDELQAGIAWVAFWREGRSWHSDYIYLETDDTLTPEDRGRLREIQEKDPAAVVLAAALAGGGVAFDGGDIAAGGALHDTRVAEPVDDDIPWHGVRDHPLRLIRPVPAQQRGAGAGPAGQGGSGLIEAPLHKGHAPGLTVQAQPLAVLGAVGAGWALRGAQLSPSDVQRPPIQRPPPAGPPRW